MGAERKSMVISNEEKRVTAYHEAGHTLVGLKVPERRPRAQGHHHSARHGAGVTQQLPEGEIVTATRRNNLLGQISILMAAYRGRNLPR